MGIPRDTDPKCKNKRTRAHAHTQQVLSLIPRCWGACMHLATLHANVHEWRACMPRPTSEDDPSRPNPSMRGTNPSCPNPYMRGKTPHAPTPTSGEKTLMPQPTHEGKNPSCPNPYMRGQPLMPQPIHEGTTPLPGTARTHGCSNKAAWEQKYMTAEMHGCRHAWVQKCMGAKMHGCQHA